MTKVANKRRSKAEVLAELESQLAAGQTLRERPIKDDLELAWASVERLSWRLEVLKQLPHMSKGIQAAADFNRAAAPAELNLTSSLEDELKAFHNVLDAQIAALRTAVERWRKSNTRPLNA